MITPRPPSSAGEYNRVMNGMTANGMICATVFPVRSVRTFLPGPSGLRYLENSDKKDFRKNATYLSVASQA
jgi:hypothetical protein